MTATRNAGVDAWRGRLRSRILDIGFQILDFRLQSVHDRFG